MVVAYVGNVATAEEGAPICHASCEEVYAVVVDVGPAAKSLEVQTSVELVWGQVASTAATWMVV